MNQEKKIKYHEQNVEKLYEAVKTGTAPFLPNEKSFGPIPRENSLTLTPLFLAVIKCPNSWIKIISSKSKTPITIKAIVVNTEVILISSIT